MTATKKLALCLWLSVCAAMCAAQESKKSARARPDLSGVWTLDKSRSDFGPFRDSPVAQADVTWAVAHNEPELKITRRATREGREEVQEFAYYSDGRGELNPSTVGRVGVKTKTKWDGDKLTAISTLTRKTSGGGQLNIDTSERWQLSKDGKTLTYVISVSSPMGTQVVKQVFTKRS